MILSIYPQFQRMKASHNVTSGETMNVEEKYFLYIKIAFESKLTLN
jgi:hypothetical protein